MKQIDRLFFSTQLQLVTPDQQRAATVDGNEKLPDGVCARATGVALVYNQPDDYGTIFVPGCLTKTRAERVVTGKVKSFADHGPFTDTHVGVVRSLDDVGDTAVATIDLFDTKPGQDMRDYLRAVLASGADTGLSIGFRPRDKEWKSLPPEMAAKLSASGARMSPDDLFCFYKEIELREISFTPVPAVPGADVVGVRREAGEPDDLLLKRGLRSILRSLPEPEARAVFAEVYAASSTASTAESDTPDAPQPSAAASTVDADTRAGSESGAAVSPAVATMEQRIRAMRDSYTPIA